MSVVHVLVRVTDQVASDDYHALSQRKGEQESSKACTQWQADARALCWYARCEKDFNHLCSTS